MGKLKVTISWLDNYGANAESLPGVVATSDSLEGVKKAYLSALKFHLLGMKKDGDSIPQTLKGKVELDFEFTAEALLHHLSGYITRSAIARVTGINEKQLGHYIQGKKTPRLATKKKLKKGIRKIGEELIQAASH